MEILYFVIVSFIVGVAGGWVLASTRPALGTKLAEKKITIGEIKKVRRELFPEIYVTIGAMSTGLLGYLLPLFIRNVHGIVKFQRLSDGETKAVQGLRWLTAGLDCNIIDITLPGEYQLLIASDNQGVLCPGDDMPVMGGYPLTETYDITVQLLGPTNKVIAERHFPQAIIDGKIITTD